MDLSVELLALCVISREALSAKRESTALNIKLSFRQEKPLNQKEQHCNKVIVGFGWSLFSVMLRDQERYEEDAIPKQTE